MRPLALLLLFAACGPAPSPRGKGEVRRVVSLLPSFTEIVVELGAGDRLVACTEYCRPGREVRRVPWQSGGAAEAVLRTRPDLVVKQEPRRDDDPLRRILEQSGVRVLALPSETIGDVRRAIARIGAALDLHDAATAYVGRFDAEMLRAREGGRGPTRPTVLFVFGRDPDSAANITAAGPGSFLDELIRYAGGENVLGDLDAPYPALSLEAALRRKPEVIIDNQPGAADVRDIWAGYRMVPAVRDGRVYAVHDPDLLIPGPRLPEAVRRMVDMIHGRP